MEMDSGRRPQGVSLLCLSCHDGAMSGGDVAMNSSFMIADDGLLNGHPFSIAYNPAPGKRLHMPVADKVGGLPLYQAPGGKVSDQIECTTCHDPHNKTFKYYLRMDNSGSSLCMTCHDL